MPWGCYDRDGYWVSCPKPRDFSSSNDSFEESFGRLVVRESDTATRSRPPIARRAGFNATYEYSTSYHDPYGTTIRSSVKVTYSSHEEPAFGPSRIARGHVSRPVVVEETRIPNRIPARDRDYSHAESSYSNRPSRYGRDDRKDSRFDGGKNFTDSHHGDTRRMETRHRDVGQGDTLREETRHRDTHQRENIREETRYRGARRRETFREETRRADTRSGESRHGHPRRSSNFDDHASSKRQYASGRNDKLRGDARQKLLTVDEVAFVDYYEVLGVPSYASMDEIKKAARQKRVQSHPDRCIKAGMSEEEIRLIKEKAALAGQAADELTDESTRKMFDAQRRKMGV